MDNPIAGLMDYLKGMASRAMEPEVKEPGPGDVGPSVETRKTPGQNTLVTLPVSIAETKAWWKRIDRATARVKAQEDDWDTLLSEYMPLISRSGEPETVKVMQHFRNVHSKIGQLFYQTPDLVLTSRDPSLLNLQMPNPMAAQMGRPLPPLTMEDIVAIKSAVLNMKMGRDGLKAGRLIDELLFDILAWAGIGCAKLGYRCVYRPIPDPSTSPGAVLGLAQPMATIPVPIYEEWYWRRFSPKKVLWNDDLRSTRFDEDATWVGHHFYMSPRMAARAFQLEEDELNKAAKDDRRHEYDDDRSSEEQLVHGVEAFCKASYFSDEVHPEAIYQLILIEGIDDRPVVWRPSPDQTFDERGQLTKDSLRGFPITVMTVRDLADSCFPVADSGYTNSEIKQLSTWRRQSIALRDKAVGKMLYDSEVFTDETERMIKGSETVYIPVEGGRLKDGADALIATTAQPTQTQDDYRNQQIIQQDINETLGISSNAAGNFTDTARTATEAANVQTNMQGRMGKELGRVVDFYLDGVRKIDQLIMRYADQEDYVEITGPDGAKRMQVWNRAMVSGKFLYNIAPDSSLHIDTAQDFKLTVMHWNVVAKSPLTNQAYFLKRLAQMRGMDPAKAVIPPQMAPKPEPEPKGKFSLSINGADFANPLIVKMLVDNDIIKVEDVALNNPVQPKPPEGAADKADVISQHVASNSGSRENQPGADNFRDSQPG